MNNFELEEIISIEECGEEECYDIGNFENDCFENEGNFLCNDILVHNCIPEWVARRDDPKKLWAKKEDPRIVELLKENHGVICYQEELTRFWVKYGGLTVPEAEKARKAVAKKKKDQIIKLFPKIVKNMVKNGFPNDPKPQNEEGIYAGAKPNSAQGWANKMVSFGRYAFNKSHAYAYGLVAYRALWMKAHYPTEFWASILTYCHQDKVPKYVSVAKSEGVVFKPIKMGNLYDKLTVDEDGNLYPSLIMVKGIGAKAAESLSKTKGECDNIDDFVDRYGKNKGVIERLIKLGAFDEIYKEISRKILWFWYQYKYSTKNEEVKTIRDMMYDAYMAANWPEQKLNDERKRQVKEFKRLHPGKRIPIKVSVWKPNFGHNCTKPTFKEFTIFWEKLWNQDNKGKDKHYYKDWTPRELLRFEKEYLGMYWTSPLRLYMHNHNFNFKSVREDEFNCSFVDGVIEKITQGVTKNGYKFTNIFVNDGTETNQVRVWDSSMKGLDRGIVKEEAGVRLSVEWSEKYQNFNLSKNGSINALRKADEDDPS
jgi:DNA polymerase III alpha subunit